MAKQVQLLRGTTAQNNAFTGEEGALTYDTDKKQLRVHDGSTLGGASFVDSVVEFQAPTAENNYTWVRKYTSGWVEQGGLATAGETAITFEVQMADTNYYPSLTAGRTSAWAGDYIPMYYNKTTTGMTIKFDSESTDNCWEIKGMAAQS